MQGCAKKKKVNEKEKKVRMNINETKEGEHVSRKII